MSILTNEDLEQMAIEIKLPLVGVFCKDELPKKKIEGFYIINMQNSVDSNGKSLGGTHWISAGIWKGKSFYFDSFGCICPNEVKKFLPKPIMYNTQQIQSIDSSDCGYFAFCCCYYLYKNGLNETTYDKFVKMFDENNFKKNDKVIQKYSKKIFKV